MLPNGSQRQVSCRRCSGAGRSGAPVSTAHRARAALPVKRVLHQGKTGKVGLLAATDSGSWREQSRFKGLHLRRFVLSVGRVAPR